MNPLTLLVLLIVGLPVAVVVEHDGRGNPEVGEAVNVRYDPQDPERIRLREWNADYTWPIALGAGAVLTLVATFRVLIAPLPRERGRWTEGRHRSEGRR